MTGLVNAGRVRTDAAGNVLLTGSFQGGQIDFGLGPLSAGNNFSTFVVTLSPGGAALWSRLLASPADADSITGARVAADGSGGWAIAADCTAPVSMDGVTVSPKQGSDVCMLRLDAQGHPAATHVFATPLEDHLADLAVTPGGKVVVVGTSWDAAGNDTTAFQAFVGM